MYFTLIIFKSIYINSFISNVSAEGKFETIAILEPIDLSSIQRKIRNDEYKVFEEFQADVELLVNNAKKYYDCNDKGRGRNN